MDMKYIQQKAENVNNYTKKQNIEHICISLLVVLDTF